MGSLKYFNTTLVLFKRNPSDKDQELFRHFNTTLVLFKLKSQFIHGVLQGEFQYYSSSIQTYGLTIFPH